METTVSQAQLIFIVVTTCSLSCLFRLLRLLSASALSPLPLAVTSLLTARASKGGSNAPAACGSYKYISRGEGSALLLHHTRQVTAGRGHFIFALIRPLADSTAASFTSGGSHPSSCKYRYCNSILSPYPKPVIILCQTRNSYRHTSFWTARALHNKPHQSGDKRRLGTKAHTGERRRPFNGSNCLNRTDCHQYLLSQHRYAITSLTIFENLSSSIKQGNILHNHGTDRYAGRAHR
jgi:hypothetical protein